MYICMYIYICMNIYIYIYLYVYVYVYLYICIFLSKPYLAWTELDDCAARRWRSKRLIVKIDCLRLLHILFDQYSEIHCNHTALGYVHKNVFWCNEANFDEVSQTAWCRSWLSAQSLVKRKFVS